MKLFRNIFVRRVLTEKVPFYVSYKQTGDRFLVENYSEIYYKVLTGFHKGDLLHKSNFIKTNIK
jgi:hypothetical protein